ncbi:MAG: MltA domain-containing protein [Rhodospirillales bacterium]|nr:MltA domain-containing protein [Rhodospirillales bacterium]
MIDPVKKWVTLGAALAVLSACGFVEFGAKPTAPPQTPAGLTLTPVKFTDLPGWTGDHHARALPAILKSCSRIGKMPMNKSWGPGGVAGLAADWRKPCAGALRVQPGNDAAARYYIESTFDAFLAAAGNTPDGLFTGYYEAELTGAGKPSGRYRVPIYAPPADLKAVKERSNGRYKSRGEIVGGALQNKGLELMWVDDPVDAFFLHIQGSGRVAMTDGRVVRIGYAGDNGHKYVSIGRELIARGTIPREKLSMQSIRAWITNNPVRGDNLMAQNPRYIFFRELPGKEGPIGAEGVALTPERSLAIDKKFVPLGVPLWLTTIDPLNPNKAFNRLMVTQDTGSAIVGAVRGDIFFGFGDEAARRAGNMKAKGRYYLLLPKKTPIPIS